MLPLVAALATLALMAAPTQGVCPSLPVPQSATVTSCPPTVNTGDSCTAACKQGYETATGDTTRTCQADGSWSGATLSCKDINACDTLPCDGEVSTCQDRAAPAVGHDCVCLPGFEGTAGNDGSGCQRAPEIVSEDGNLRAIVGPYNSIKFEMGSTVIDAAQIKANSGGITSLSNSLNDLKTTYVDVNTNAISQLRLDTETAMSTARADFTDLDKKTNERIDQLVSDQATFEQSVNQAVIDAGDAAEQARQQISDDLSAALQQLSDSSQDQHSGHYNNFSTIFLTLTDLENQKADKAWVTGQQGKLPDETMLKDCGQAQIGYLRFHKGDEQVQVCKTGGWGVVTAQLGTKERPALSCGHLATEGVKEDGIYYVLSHQEYCRLSHPGHIISLGGDGTSQEAAAHSCRTIMDLHEKVDGNPVRWLKSPTGEVYQTLCDFLRNGGGWTLLVQSNNDHWISSDVLERGTQYGPDDDFSVLKHADDIKNSRGISSNVFEYRLEANEVGHWGGTFRAPRHYSFVATSNTQTNIELVEKFDTWVFDDKSIERRMPWRPSPADGCGAGNSCALLTTSEHPDSNWHGTIVQQNSEFDPAPWIADGQLRPGVIWYWMREGPVIPNGPADMGSFANPANSCTELNAASKPSGLYYFHDGIDTYQQYCHNGQVISGDGTKKDRPAQSCRFVKDKFVPHYGVDKRWIKSGSTIFETYCDFDQGGFLLLVTSDTNQGWNKATRLLRGDASTSTDFSVLQYADAIKNTAPNKNFEYMLEAYARGRFGGIWSAPFSYSFLREDNTQTNVDLTSKFDLWNYHNNGVEKRMPWLGGNCGMLTTSELDCGSWWGTVLSNSGWNPAPWMDSNTGAASAAREPQIIWYWMREGESDLP